VSNLLAGLLGALLATNQPAAVSNLIQQQTGLAVEMADPNDPVEKEYRQIMQEDDAAQDEVDKWIVEDEKFSGEGLNLKSATLRPRILQRLDPVRKHYEDFLQRHPKHARARIAYGSFLNDLGEEQPASEQWQKATEVDPRQPAAWNNLANYYGHNGEAKKAFACYDKAIEISPRESVYYQNLATTTYLFRKDAMEHYGLGEEQLYERVMSLYRKALALDPANFSLATELAQTYYGFKPVSTNGAAVSPQVLQSHYDAAAGAWQAALKLARDEVERQGVYVHLARVNLLAGHREEARRNLTLITNGMYTVARDRLQRRLDNPGTNAVSNP
jgi:tetratricopeptide (TPR) repeat protein